jgi:glucose-6-phosphate 1-dehydrogenase
MKTKLVIFGITGDLSRRKLLPALAQIISTGDFDDLSVVGVSRHELSIQQLFRPSVGDALPLSRVSELSMDLGDLDDYVRLKELLCLKDDEQAIMYLSVPPIASGQIVELLGQSGLNTPNIKIMLEKPFGTNLESARRMVNHVAQHYDESQIYRIDHYLAKEMSQNIVAFRGRNALFDHVWDNKSIEKIEIVAQEVMGIEGRIGFYEQTGALRDVLQGHLMQLLALVLMDVPQDFDWNDIPALRLEALHQIEVADPNKAIRGQYETYRTEVGSLDTMTETFVSVELNSVNSKWQGVPLVLTAGKALDSKATEVRVNFRKSHEAQTNCLVFKIQPSEGVEIKLFTKKPGYDRQFEEKKLSFEYPSDAMLPEAYEQVIVDAIASQKSLFASSDEVLRSWEILRPIQKQWSEKSDDLRQYKAGSSAEDVLSSTNYI